MLSPKPWRAEATLRFGAALCASILFGMMLGRALSSPSSPLAGASTAVSIAVGTLSFHVIALVLAHFFLAEHGMGWKEGFGFGAPRLGRALLLSLIVGAASLPIILSLGNLCAKIMRMIKMDPVAQESVQTLQSSESLGIKLLIGFLAVVVAPLAEEVIFRGIIYPTIKQHGYPRFALWGTSFLFAAVHGNLMIFIPLTFLAVVLTLLYETTDNILAPVLTHSLFNLANFFLLVVVQPKAG